MQEGGSGRTKRETSLRRLDVRITRPDLNERWPEQARNEIRTLADSEVQSEIDEDMRPHKPLYDGVYRTKNIVYLVRQLQTTFDSIRQLETAFVSFRQHSTTFGSIRQQSTTIDRVIGVYVYAEYQPSNGLISKCYRRCFDYMKQISTTLTRNEARLY